MISILISALCLWVVSNPLLAQTALQVYWGDLSVPFGTVPGKILTIGDYLVFIDDDKQEMCFAVNRSDIQNFTSQDETVTVELRQPVQDRSGQRSRFSFRLKERANIATLTRWSSTAGLASGTAGTGTTQIARITPVYGELLVYPTIPGG